MQVREEWALPHNRRSEHRSNEESSAVDVKILRFTQNDIVMKTFGATALRLGREEYSLRLDFPGGSVVQVVAAGAK